LITPVINDIIAAKEISKLASAHNMSIPVHVNIDTGMCRMGIPYQRAISTILEMAELSHIKLEGIMTHFSNADISDAEMTKHQLALFKKLIAELEEKGLRFRYRHISNSAAVLNLKRAHMNMVRPGIMLYGYGPNGCCDELLPVMSLKSSIIYLKRVPKGTPISYGGIFVTKKESLIATIPAGYADGYSRMLSNRAEVIIRGKRAPVVGRICMDLFMVDVTEIDGVREGDEVTLIGKDGGEEITAEDIANMMGTITYEVLTSISHDLRRVYIGRESHMLAKDT
ncbi:MAG: alanine racemase, partial [Nitrospirae bacterium]